jgi:adenylate cyclase
MTKLEKKRYFLVLTISTTIAAIFCIALHFNLLHSLQQRSSDFLFQTPDLHQDTKPQDKIVIVGIDDKSLKELCRISQWPRSYYAQLLATLADANARVVVFDILFSEPAAGDEELAMSIRNAGNVILPVIHLQAIGDPIDAPNTTQTRYFLKPLVDFVNVALTLGHANINPDADGVVRKLAPVIQDNDEYRPALALAAVSKYLRRSEILEALPRDNILPFAGRLIPLNDNATMLINYIDNTQGVVKVVNFRIVSFADVLNGVANPAFFEDKIVIIGVTASGLGDTFWTPMGLMINGVEIHASAMHTILTGNFLKPAPVAVTIASIIAMSLLCGLAASRLRVIWASLLTLLLCITYYLAAFSFFDRGIMLNLLYPPLALVSTFIGVNLFNVASERSKKREVTKTFGRYISTQVADKILTALENGKLELAGEEQEVTVVFADARNFTSISEKVPPEELVRTLNYYLTIIIKAISKYDGTINKFGGDSVMAIWNAPVENRGHALLSIKAALYAQRAIEEWQERGMKLPQIEFGIGINTGRAVSGNVGATDRLEYSVIGDTVNTAARLASATPGGKVWIGINTFEQVKDYVIAEPLTPLTVKGKQEAIEAYEITGIKNWQFDDESKAQ